MTHICVSKLTIIVSDNGLSPGRREAIIWTNDGILLIRTFRTHFSEIVSEIHTFTFKNMHFKMSSGKWWPSCLSLNVLISSRCFTYALLYHWCYASFSTISWIEVISFSWQFLHFMLLMFLASIFCHDYFSWCQGFEVGVLMIYS